MQYVLFFAERPEEVAKRDGPEAPAYWGAWSAYMGAIAAAGVMRGGAGLLPAAAGATVRLAAGRPEVQDGPFADTKEQLGGYVTIEVDDLDAALDWAARAPCAGAGAIEIRPVIAAGA
ncbi:MAG: YciI family protein [Rubritepida sp.]|jgi:hypothetical protein|nr:YciI family protein [Rubritepida sp.]